MTEGEALGERPNNSPLQKGAQVCKGLENVSLGGYKFTNDPSAGSPTETLLRLLLPLNDQV